MPTHSLNAALSPSHDIGRISYGYLPDGVTTDVANGRSALAALRQWRGLTCWELSEQSGVDLIIIMLAERGSDLMAEERAAIAAVLNVDEELIG